ncbi:Sec-independent protein translocase subunit TatA/TatB [Adhaeribacter rhizoryzae]|uniref:Sec-independent protein translocase protein TatA n=1 Tax=Adhaeribacter rhizoryzae TaxID=2607907 RepID=A0A5M6DNW2_9BACT|nr:twin-arginine translocase TatA/TatE family subunit [Adhaeribacter rhizoryzae]KAA5549187.1 twin-arginine translocase TatA/TatE family subunit [Adhaeribacter rhizoryzae]
MQLNTMLLFLGDVGGGEIMVIMVAVLLLFGADKIPGLARSLGSGIREFKDATNGIKNEIERSINDDEPRVKTKTPIVQEPVTSTETAPDQKDEESKSL